MFKLGGQTTDDVKAWGLNALKALPHTLLTKSNRGETSYPHPSIYLFSPLLHLLIFFIVICTPHPCSGEVCLHSFKCVEYSRCGRVCRERTDSIKTEYVYNPSLTDIQFKTHKDNVAKWLRRGLWIG
jgi:hypothetical protein